MIGDRGQGLDVEPDRLERILPQCNALRQHDRHGLADIAHLVMRQHRLLVGFEFRQRLEPHRYDRHSARHVFGGDHRMNAGTLQRTGGVKRSNAAMGNRAAQDHRIEQALDLEIIDKFSASAQEAQVFAPLHRRADECVLHREPPL